jgi:hypothetical protein
MVSFQPVGIPADNLAILHVHKVAVLPGASSLALADDLLLQA